VINIGHASTYATSGALLSEMFDTSVRYSGASLSFQISSVISGAPAPLVATARLAWSGGAPWPIAVYVALGGFLAFVSVFLALETYRSDLTEDRPSSSRESPSARNRSHRAVYLDSAYRMEMVRVWSAGRRAGRGRPRKAKGE
jgi:MFS transporter, MHS family, shikimate and dehydroshikimate transport protein